MTETYAKLVTDLRNQFLTESEAKPELYDPIDIDSIRTKDWTLRRYLANYNHNVSAAANAMTATMKWRKSIGVNTLDESSFPIEFYRIAGVFSYAKDRHGSTLIIFRARVNRRFREWTETIKKFVVYMIEREERRAESGETGGVAFVFDCIDAGLSNVDIDLLSFLVSLMRDHYPGLLVSVMVVELPCILRWVFKLVQSWLPDQVRHQLRLVDKRQDMVEYVEIANLPDYMGGTNKTPYRLEPKGATTALELGPKLGIKAKDLDKFLRHVESHYE